MASGTLGADDLPKKNKWSGNSKVYTRKVFRNPKKNQSIVKNQGETSQKTTVENNSSDKYCIVNKNPGETSNKTTVENNVSDKNCIVNGTVTNNIVKNHESVVKEVPINGDSIELDPTINDNNVGNTHESVVVKVPCNVNNIEKEPDNENDIEQAHDSENIFEEGQNCENNIKEAPQNENNIEELRYKFFSPKLPSEEAILSQTQKNMSHIEAVTLSEDSSSYNRVEADLPNGHDHFHDDNLANGVVREDRPMVTQVNDMLNISVTAAKSKVEVRILKRKLEDELDQVRKMARMLEAKETELSSAGFDSGRFHVPVNGGMNNGNISMRAAPELGSVSYSHPRPFGQIYVDVMDKSYYGGGEVPHEKERRTPKANRNYSEFVLGKERLPPSESNRKTKSSGGGRKHRRGEFDTGIGFDKNINKKCSDLLQKLRKHKLGWVFNQPVDVKSLGLHDYFDIITHPMDLGTVKTRLTNNWYKTPREFAEDVRLTFRNAMTYNPEGQDVHTMAKELLRIFEEKWPAIETAFDRKLNYQMFRDVGTPTPTSRKSFIPSRIPIPIPMPLPPPPLLHTPQPFQESRNFERSKSMPVRPLVGRKPALQKPKAKDVDKREMTFDEKQKLSTNLQGLPSEKLDVIVQIIKKRNTALSQHDDEIEVDIDSVDTETLWELDRFVTNYKKSLSKYKRRAELAAQRAAAAQAIQETVPPAPILAPANVEAPREDKADDGNPVTSPHVQQERHSNNGYDTSSSSSSGSDSGSSSSDSDSSSSSDSDSDEDK